MRAEKHKSDLSDVFWPALAVIFVAAGVFGNEYLHQRAHIAQTRTTMHWIRQADSLRSACRNKDSSLLRWERIYRPGTMDTALYRPFSWHPVLDSIIVPSTPLVKTDTVYSCYFRANDNQNDSLELAKLIDKGFTKITFGNGHFLFEHGFIIHKSGITLCGSGNTHIEFIAPEEVAMPFSFAPGVTRCLIRDFKFDHYLRMPELFPAPPKDSVIFDEI